MIIMSTIIVSIIITIYYRGSDDPSLFAHALRAQRHKLGFVSQGLLRLKTTKLSHTVSPFPSLI